MARDIWGGTRNESLRLHTQIGRIPLGCAGYGSYSQDEMVEGFDVCCWVGSHFSDVLEVYGIRESWDGSRENRIEFDRIEMVGVGS